MPIGKEDVSLEMNRQLWVHFRRFFVAKWKVFSLFLLAGIFFGVVGMVRVGQWYAGSFTIVTPDINRGIEQERLLSRNLIQKALDRTGYMRVGAYVDMGIRGFKEMYAASPFEVLIHSCPDAFRDIPFDISFQDSTTFELSSDPLNFRTQAQLSVPITVGGLNISIVPSDFWGGNSASNKYRFVIRSDYEMVQNVIHNYDVYADALNVERLEITYSAQNPDHVIDFMNAVIVEYFIAYQEAQRAVFDQRVALLDRNSQLLLSDLASDPNYKKVLRENLALRAATDSLASDILSNTVRMDSIQMRMSNLQNWVKKGFESMDPTEKGAFSQVVVSAYDAWQAAIRDRATNAVIAGKLSDLRVATSAVMHADSLEWKRLDSAMSDAQTRFLIASEVYDDILENIFEKSVLSSSLAFNIERLRLNAMERANIQRTLIRDSKEVFLSDSPYLLVYHPRTRQFRIFAFSVLLSSFAGLLFILAWFAIKKPMSRITTLAQIPSWVQRYDFRQERTGLKRLATDIVMKRLGSGNAIAIVDAVINAASVDLLLLMLKESGVKFQVIGQGSDAWVTAPMKIEHDWLNTSKILKLIQEAGPDTFTFVLLPSLLETPEARNGLFCAENSILFHGGTTKIQEIADWMEVIDATGNHALVQLAS